MVSFYTMYKRHPVGDYHIGVCTTSLCGIMGGDQILAELHEHLGVGDDEVTRTARSAWSTSSATPPVTTPR